MFFPYESAAWVLAWGSAGPDAIQSLYCNRSVKEVMSLRALLQIQRASADLASQPGRPFRERCTEVPVMASAISSSRRITAGLYFGFASSSLLAAVALTMLVPDIAWAQEDDPTEKIRSVLDNIRNWIVGIAAILVVVMLTIAGVRYLLANDPSEAERAKVALKAAAVGFAIILLAPFLVAILAEILTG